MNPLDLVYIPPLIPIAFTHIIWIGKHVGIVTASQWFPWLTRFPGQTVVRLNETNRPMVAQGCTFRCDGFHGHCEGFKTRSLNTA